MLPSYTGIDPTQLLRLNPDFGEVYNIAWTGESRWLLAGTVSGLVGWRIDDEKVGELKPGDYT
jgi:hypothetical protein